MLEPLGFGLTAALLLTSGFKVVSSKNLIHSVLWLGLLLAATAVLFVLLQAPLLAAIQIILYTGGLLTLMLFGVMLTQRDRDFLVIPNASRRALPAALCAGAGFGLFALALTHTPGLPDEPPQAISPQQLGELFFTQNVLAFEVLAVLLLAATLGAIVLARRDDAGSAAEPVIPARRPLPEPLPRATEEMRS